MTEMEKGPGYPTQGVELDHGGRGRWGSCGRGGAASVAPTSVASPLLTLRRPLGG